MNALVKKGLPRKKAYPLIRKISQELKEEEHLKPALQKNKEIKKYLNPKDLKEIFSESLNLSILLKHLDKTLKKI